MKRVICLILLLGMVFSLAACAAKETPPVSAPPPAEKAVPKPLTWADIDAIPIATDDMTEDELRQICIDFFRLQLSFQWTPKEDLDYEITGYHKFASFPAGTVYAGLPYMNPSQTGNLYVLMEHYDPQTGILDNTVLDNQTFVLRIGNNCASGSFWGWARVVNSTSNHSCRYATTAFGFLPVGPYVYDQGILDWNPSNTTPTVCQQNGDQVMFASYAALKPADGLVCHYGKPGNAHMRMVVDVVVEQTPEGTIDGKKSYITYLDQTSNAKSTDMDGHTVLVQGGVDRTISFRALYKAGYLPFTFAELIGLDPVEPAEVRLDVANPVTAEALCYATLHCNYSISHLILTVTDREGNEVYRSTYYPQDHDQRNSQLYGLVHIKGLEPFVGEDYTTTVSCRASTGQVLTAWTGTLTK